MHALWTEREKESFRRGRGYSQSKKRAKSRDRKLTQIKCCEFWRFKKEKKNSSNSRSILMRSLLTLFLFLFRRYISYNLWKYGLLPFFGAPIGSVVPRYSTVGLACILYHGRVRNQNGKTCKKHVSRISWSVVTLNSWRAFMFHLPPFFTNTVFLLHGGSTASHHLDLLEIICGHFGFGCLLFFLSKLFLWL